MDDACAPRQIGDRAAQRDQARLELGAFLRRKRAAIKPSEVGLVRLPAQRSPGLSRAQIARLAAISVNWYSAIESGRARRISEGTLAAIVIALRLNRADERTFRRLATATFASNPDAGIAE